MYCLPVILQIWAEEFGKPLYRKSEIILLPVRMQLYIEIILLPVRKKLYLVKNDQELTVSSRYRVSGIGYGLIAPVFLFSAIMTDTGSSSLTLNTRLCSSLRNLVIWQGCVTFWLPPAYRTYGIWFVISLSIVNILMCIDGVENSGE